VADHLLINVFNVDAAFAIGRAKGFFAATEIEVCVQVTPNSTEQMRGLAHGAWPIVSTAFDNVLGWSGCEGAEILAIAQIAQGITLPVYVRPEIKTWDDLRGKPLAVDAVDTAYALVLRRILLDHDLIMGRGDYSLIAKGTTGRRLNSMIRGETFAGILNPPWDGKAEAVGMVRFADHRGVLPDYPGAVYAVERRRAQAHRTLLVNFLSAWQQSLLWCHAENHRAEAVKLIADCEKLNEKAAANRLRQLPACGALHLRGLQSVLDLPILFKLAPPMGEDLTAYYDRSCYLRSVAVNCTGRCQIEEAL
jgi:ABC-type nitrate/sulfonate/bicarbonate transport system substrate-binding protein